MKTVLCLLICFLLLGAQNSSSQNSPYKVEWKSEFPIRQALVSGLAVNGDNIYLTQTEEFSIFNVLNTQGTITFTSLANNTRIRSLFVNDNYVYSIGDQHFTQRDFNGKVLNEVMLPLLENGYISSRNGKILNGKVYTSHVHSYFLKYSLTGQQLFRKVVGSSDNHKLEIGGDHIYLYSTMYDQASNPRLMQYDTLGNQKWSIGAGDVRAMVADEEGNCYVASAEVHSTLTRFDTDGKVIWAVPITGQLVRGMAKKGDSIFVCGNVSLDAMTSNKQACAFSIISAATGQIIHQQKFLMVEDENEREYFNHIASDGKNLYMGGAYGWEYQTPFLLKFSKEGTATGLKDEQGNKTRFNVFPNPGGSRFIIACDEPGNPVLKVTVRNIAGQVVQKKELNCEGQKSWELDLGRQPAGNYTIEILSGDRQVVKKVVVQ